MQINFDDAPQSLHRLAFALWLSEGNAAPILKDTPENWIKFLKTFGLSVHDFAAAMRWLAAKYAADAAEGNHSIVFQSLVKQEAAALTEYAARVTAILDEMYCGLAVGGQH